SYNETREATIGAIEAKITEAFPELDVRRAFTSQTIIDKLEKRDGLKIDNVTEAMDRLVADGVKKVAIQPTHVMSGKEYDEMKAAAAPYEDKFDKIAYGVPLLTSEEDYKKIAEILAADTAEYNTDGTAIVFMGHGTKHAANSAYQKLADVFKAEGKNNYFVGTVEAEPSLDDVMAGVEKIGAKKVVLLPLMIVAGDHATKDMSGDTEDSWKTKFKAEGYDVQCVLKGLGEYKDIQELFVEHAKAAVNEMEGK
ncbi:MAG: sirohydrochlorin cobaltochelatase, partial [Oscillospiraceae bacterium]